MKGNIPDCHNVPIIANETLNMYIRGVLLLPDLEYLMILLLAEVLHCKLILYTEGSLKKVSFNASLILPLRQYPTIEMVVINVRYFKILS